jgi:hypothetical protein
MKLKLIINEDIHTTPSWAYETLQDELCDINEHMTFHYNKLTDIQQEKLRDTFFLMSDNGLTALLTNTDSRNKFIKRVAKGYRRQDAVLTLIELEQERREIQCLLYGYQERKEKLTLISRQSESDIIRARLKAFGNNLRSQRN